MSEGVRTPLSQSGEHCQPRAADCPARLRATPFLPMPLVMSLSLSMFSFVGCREYLACRGTPGTLLGGGGGTAGDVVLLVPLVAFRCSSPGNSGVVPLL